MIDRNLGHTITHIKQKSNWDCAIASIAMMAGVDYSDVLKKFEKKFPESIGRGLSDSEILTLMKSYGMKPLIIDYVFFDISAILFLPSKNESNGDHAVYFCGKEIYDPNYKRTGIKFYPKKIPKELPKGTKSVVDKNDYFTALCLKGLSNGKR